MNKFAATFFDVNGKTMRKTHLIDVLGVSEKALSDMEPGDSETVMINGVETTVTRLERDTTM